MSNVEVVSNLIIEGFTLDEPSEVTLTIPKLKSEQAFRSLKYRVKKVIDALDFKTLDFNQDKYILDLKPFTSTLDNIRISTYRGVER